MELIKAVILSLGEVQEPVVTRYRLGLVVHELYVRKEYKGEKISRLQKDSATGADFVRQLASLEDSGVLLPYPGFETSVFGLLGRKNDEPEEIACTIDPFCYVSHLSAMAHHGLTNRIPAKLFVSSPAAGAWKTFAAERMARDLGEAVDDYRNNGMPVLTRVAMEKIGRMEVHRFNSSHLGAYKNVRGKIMRVSSVGRTFLEMLRNPELCGGMRHVVEVYEEHGAQYRQLIVGELDQHGTAIEKVRAGYLLEEKLKLNDPVIESWTRFAQRGGSRKLDPSGEYEPKWSDKWCLSLNL